MSDAEATLVVTAGTSMYGLTELGGLVAGESVVVIGPGPIGLLAVAVAKALGAEPVILTGTRNKRLEIGKQLGADRVININDENAVDVVKQLTGGIGADYVVECAGTEATIEQAIHMTNRGGKICLAAFPHDPGHHRPGPSRQEQHLRLRHPRRRQERDQARDGADGGKAF